MSIGEYYVMESHYGQNGESGTLVSTYKEAEQMALEKLKNDSTIQRLYIEQIDKNYYDNDGCYDDIDAHLVKWYKNN